MNAPSAATNFRQTTSNAHAQLRDVAKQLGDLSNNAEVRSQTPPDTWNVLGETIHAVDSALRSLAAIIPLPSADLPTPQQGQFLAFIRDYITTHHGIAPSHSIMQQYFDLTPPSVNSMLVRLESRGFIRRIPKVARAIELTIDPALIPRLLRPLKR